MKPIDVTSAEVEAAEQSLWRALKVKNVRPKLRRGALTRAVNRFIKNHESGQALFVPPPCVPNRRGQTLVAIHRYLADQGRLREDSDRPKVVLRKSAPIEPAPSSPTHGRPTAAQKEAFYRSWEWRTLRMQVLKEYGPRCQCCGATPNDLTVANEPVRIVVDHIKPLSKYWHLRLDRNNLSVLCDECNQGKGAWDETDWRPASAA